MAIAYCNGECGNHTHGEFENGFCDYCYLFTKLHVAESGGDIQGAQELREEIRGMNETNGDCAIVCPEYANKCPLYGDKVLPDENGICSMCGLHSASNIPPQPYPQDGHYTRTETRTANMYAIRPIEWTLIESALEAYIELIDGDMANYGDDDKAGTIAEYRQIIEKVKAIV